MAGSSSFQVNTEGLKTQGTHFHQLGEDFSASVTRLMDGLSALGAGPPATAKPGGGTPPEKSFGQQFVGGLTTLDSMAGAPPWGDDDIGEKFGVVYEGVRDGMYESMGHLSAQFQKIGKALQEMSKNHAENEDFNDTLIKQKVANKQGWQDPTASSSSMKPV
ncbi:hypothetical protein [Streptomyces sp. NPDC059080]|uniref:hypothetical protein n=1 Tax=Streptomyces sp. NPDC059080 TaxID=3346718 RepID=UPI00367434EA